MTVAVIAGAAWSMLSGRLMVAVLPAASTAVPEKRWAAPSVAALRSAGQVASFPLSSAQVKWIVTGVRNQPLPAVCDRAAVIVGGVWSEPVLTVVVVVVAPVTGSTTGVFTVGL